MIREKRLLRLISTVGVLPFLLAGCRLLPEEEVLPAAPVIKAYEMNEYEQTEVLRGDLTREITVRCNFVPTRQEHLGFSIGGEYVENIYVSEGQEVKAGDLLAELNCGDITEQIDALEYRIRRLELQRAHLTENHALSLEKKKVELELADEKTIREALGMLEKEYGEQLQKIEDTLYIESLYLKEQREELQKRQLFAGIDGTVTYVKVPEEGERNVEGRTYVSISDISSSMFEVEEKDSGYFEVGETTLVICKDKEYQAVVEEQEGTIYLALAIPDPALEKGDKGSVSLVLDTRSDVCYLDKKAICYADNKTFVYMQDEDGWKVMRDVVTGLENENYIEIISGLEAGDSVILP